MNLMDKAYCTLKTDEERIGFLHNRLAEEIGSKVRFESLNKTLDRKLVIARKKLDDTLKDLKSTTDRFKEYMDQAPGNIVYSLRVENAGAWCDNCEELIDDYMGQLAGNDQMEDDQ